MEIMEKKKKEGIHEEKELLSSDSIYEVLTRVPLDDLLCQCQWVCKDWQKLIYDTNFKLIHSQRTQTISGYFIQSREISKSCSTFVSIIDYNSSSSSQTIPSASLDFLPTNSKIRASSSHGLLCCVDETESTRIPAYYICKPTTHQWRKIPNPKTRYVTDRMVMMVKESYPKLHYKIMRYSSPKTRPWYLHCEIFDSKNWAWKRLNDIKLPHDVFLEPGRGILVNGGFHWLTSDGRIFVFNIDQENWTIIKLPREQVQEMTNNDILDVQKKLVDYQGKIAVVYTINDCTLELWVLEDHLKIHTWEKKYSIDMGSINRIIGCGNLCDMFSTDVVVMKNFDTFMWYNCNKDTYTIAKPPGISFITEVFAFQSDLVPCSLN